jgi:hypothetical protein
VTWYHSIKREKLLIFVEREMMRFFLPQRKDNGKLNITYEEVQETNHHQTLKQLNECE